MPGPVPLNNNYARPLWLCLVAALLAGCAAPPASPTGGRRALTDGIGRTVAVAPEPRRIISLAPDLTETLFALGLGERVVGVTSYCDYPAEARAKEKVGDTINPDLERIIALKPDLVLVSTSSQLEKITGQLDRLAIPVYVTNPRSVSQVADSIRGLGEVTGARERGVELADDIGRRARAVAERVAGRPRPRVLYVLQTGPLITAGRGTFITDLIRLAGGDSIAAGEAADYPQFSRETVVARAPEVIIAPASHGSELISVEALRRDFAATPAVRQGRIALVDPNLIDRPGPRIVEGLESVARALHPE